MFTKARSGALTRFTRNSISAVPSSILDQEMKRTTKNCTDAQSEGGEISPSCTGVVVGGKHAKKRRKHPLAAGVESDAEY